MPILSSEQASMIEALGGVIATGDGYSRTRAYAAAYPAFDRTIWSRICADGWLGLLVPVQSGGFGGTTADLVALLDGIGDRLAPEPIAAAAVVAALLAGCATSAADTLLAEMQGGEATILLARPAYFPLGDGSTHVVDDAAWATHILAFDATETRRLHVSRAADLEDAPLRRTTDGGSLRFFTPAVRYEVACGDAVEALYRDARDRMRLATAASLCAIARRALAQTSSYLQQRKQFGVALATFQTLQHALASCHVGNTAARAVTFEAVRAFGGARQSTAAAMAKAQASVAAMASVKAGVQYHGGLGFCDETDVAIQFRHVQTASAAWGSPAQCLSALRDEPRGA